MPFVRQGGTDNYVRDNPSLNLLSMSPTYIRLDKTKICSLYIFTYVYIHVFENYITVVITFSVFSQKVISFFVSLVQRFAMIV